MIVCRWKRKNGFAVLAKKGQAISNDKLINFFEENEQKNCICLRVWISYFKNLVWEMIRQFLY